MSQIISAPVQQGALLLTKSVLRWSEQERTEQRAIEARRIFSGFTGADAGRSRQFVAECASPAIAAELVEIVNRNAALSAGALDVLAERRRQVEGEGWTLAHDDAHDTGAMAYAGACYAHAAFGMEGNARLPPPRHWPWSRRWWKPASPRRMLVKAAALILAEIERLDRRPKRKPMGWIE